MGTPLGTTLEANLGTPADTLDFTPPQTSILVTTNIGVVVGSNGASLTLIDQGFSSTPQVPEPASIALLGIGMAGFLAFHLLFKRIGGLMKGAARSDGPIIFSESNDFVHYVRIHGYIREASAFYRIVRAS